MDLETLRYMIDGNNLASVAVRRAAEIVEGPAKGWVVFVQRKLAKQPVIVTLARTDRPRVFKTLDAAANFVQDLGIASFTVNVKQHK